MSHPQAFFFDSSILVGFFNKNDSEVKLAQQAFSHADNFPHAARLVITPCLVEIFFKTQNIIAPQHVRQNLRLLNIELYPTTEAREKELYEAYCASTYKKEYDFADFCMCSVSLDFDPVEILTLDKDDIGLAMARAYQASSRKSAFYVRQFP